VKRVNEELDIHNPDDAAYIMNVLFTISEEGFDFWSENESTPEALSSIVKALSIMGSSSSTKMAGIISAGEFNDSEFDSVYGQVIDELTPMIKQRDTTESKFVGLTTTLLEKYNGQYK
jgi:hypothetical protein